MKGVLLIIDGLGDLPVPALGGRTPLEAARTPVLDRLAARGSYGLVDPIGPGILPNTHSGAGLLLGLHPDQVGRLSRGPVEAAGLGLELAPGDVAMRVNFAALAAGPGGLQVLDRRAGRIREGTAELARALNAIEAIEGCRFTLRPTEQHRGVLVIAGAGLDARIGDTDPGDQGMPAAAAPCRALHPDAVKTARVINLWLDKARACLAAHPVNQARRQAGLAPADGLLVRGAGQALSLDNLVDLHGLSASVVSGCNTVKGLARLLGFRVVNDPRFTADLDTDLEAKLRTVADELGRADLVFLHIKATDICAHDRQPLAKRDFLERIDAVLASLADGDVAVAVAADHTTDSNTGMHTPDPVPALIAEPGVAAGAPVKFGEQACRHGPLPRHDSHGFLQAFLAVLGRPA